MRPYVLSLVYARAYTFEIRRRNHPQGGQGGLQGPARRFVPAPVLRLGRIFDAQTSAPSHRHHLGNILSRAHNLGGNLWRGPILALHREAVKTKSLRSSAKVFVRLALFV